MTVPQSLAVLNTSLSPIAFTMPIHDHEFRNHVTLQSVESALPLSYRKCTQ